MSKAIDLTNRIFGELKAIEPTSQRKGKYIIWKCECNCGNIVYVSTKDLIGKRVRNCGCMKYKRNGPCKIFRNQKFNFLTVLEEAPKINGKIAWKCQCECGNIVVVTQNNLLTGNTKSCGCLKSNAADITNQTFGFLTAIRPTGETKNNSFVWECICECNNVCYKTVKELKEGCVKSCGCMKNIEDNYHTKISLLYKEPKLRSSNSSGYTGVYWNKRVSKWVARITFRKKNYSLGYYSDVKDAAEIRKLAENKLYGEFLDWYENEYKKANENK